MRYALLLLCAGCQAAIDIDRADIIAELATQYAAIVVNKPEAPTPDKPRDGLAVVNCRCPDDCKCKATPQNARSEPLVPVPQKTPDGGHLECEGGVCYWVDDSTGARYRVVK